MNLKDMSNTKKIIVFIALALPLVAASSFAIVLRSYRLSYNGLLSPPHAQPLFIALIIFSIGYIIFLGFLFSDNIMELFHRKSITTK